MTVRVSEEVPNEIENYSERFFGRSVRLLGSMGCNKLDPVVLKVESRDPQGSRKHSSGNPQGSRKHSEGVQGTPRDPESTARGSRKHS